MLGEENYDKVIGFRILGVGIGIDKYRTLSRDRV